MDKRLAAATLASVWCVCAVAASAGCRSKPAPPAVAAPQGAAAVRAQALEKERQQYILKRRTDARKKSRSHTSH